MYLYTILIWFVGVVIYGFFSISNTMKELKINPCNDSYANDYLFQVLAFIYSNGIYFYILKTILLY